MKTSSFILPICGSFLSFKSFDCHDLRQIPRLVYIDALDIYAAKVEEHAKHTLATLKDIYDNGKNSGKIINGQLNLRQLNVSGVPATYVAPFSQGMIKCKDSWNALVEEGLIPLSEKQRSVKL